MATPYDRREFIPIPQDNDAWWDYAGPSPYGPTDDNSAGGGAEYVPPGEEPPPPPGEEPPVVLPPVIIVGIEPIVPGFQGPLPDPLPSPGGGSTGGTAGGGVTAEAPAPRSPYSIAKPSKLRQLRFILEALAKKLSPSLANIVKRMPTPLSFAADALLIGDSVADATLFDIKSLPPPSKPFIPELWTMLDTQTVYSSTPLPSISPKITPIDSPSLSLWDFPWISAPSVSPSPLPSPLTLPQPSPTPAQDPFALPFEMPLPLGLPAPMELPLSPLNAPAPETLFPTATPWTGIIPGVIDLVAPDAPFKNPGLDTPLSPSPTLFQAGICPPCTKSAEKKKQKKKKQRNECWRGTYTELKSGLIKHRKERIPCQ